MDRNENMAVLRRPYPSIAYQKGMRCGGNQRFHRSFSVRRGGCGVIAASDLLLYLEGDGKLPFDEGIRQAYRGRKGEGAPLCEDAYHRYLGHMLCSYFPMIPLLGKTGWGLAAGMRLYMMRHHGPFRVSWGMRGGSVLIDRIREMLGRDIPVILSIGQNIPCFWRRKKLMFYRINEDGQYRAHCLVRAHFVTVIGMDDLYLHVISWGEEYYIRQEEYLQYIRHNSNPWISNILYIR